MMLKSKYFFYSILILVTILSDIKVIGDEEVNGNILNLWRELNANIKEKVQNDINNTLTEMKHVVEEVEDKWKAWIKNFDCSNKNNNLVKCILTNLADAHNPDSWKVNATQRPIPFSHPENVLSVALPSKIDNALREWLVKFQKLTNTTNEDASDKEIEEYK